MSVGLLPEPDKPGPTSNLQIARAPVQNRSQMRAVGTRAKTTSSGAHAGGTNLSHVQPVTAQAGGEASSVTTSSVSGRRPRLETVGGPLAAASSVPESGVAVPEQIGGGQLAELRAMVQAYQVALVTDGIALPTLLPSGGTTTTSAVGRAKGRAPMTVGSELGVDPAPTGGAGETSESAAETTKSRVEHVPTGGGGRNS